MNLKPTFTIEPGDGTGSSVADCIARNEKGLCGYQKCGNPIRKDSPKITLAQQVCDDCYESHEKLLRNMQEDLNKEYARMVQEAMDFMEAKEW